MSLNLFKALTVIFFKEVFPQLPVIATTFPLKLSLISLDKSVKLFKVSGTIICLF